MLNKQMRERLVRFGQALINQESASVVIEPQANVEGFWFGGGNLVEAPNGDFYLVGRYRNAGDSRLGLAAGERGLELAIFRSTDRGQSFGKILSFAKADLDVGERKVLSIEGSALHFVDGGVELDARHLCAGEQSPHVDVVDDIAADGAECRAEAADEAGLFAM